MQAFTLSVFIHVTAHQCSHLATVVFTLLVYLVVWCVSVMDIFLPNMLFGIAVVLTLCQIYQQKILAQYNTSYTIVMHESKQVLRLLFYCNSMHDSTWSLFGSKTII